jgi:hypothetical protein
MKVQLDKNSVDIHPYLSAEGHPVDDIVDQIEHKVRKTTLLLIFKS